MTKELQLCNLDREVVLLLSPERLTSQSLPATKAVHCCCPGMDCIVDDYSSGLRLAAIALLLSSASVLSAWSTVS
jgi:hypothetical protein